MPARHVPDIDNKIERVLEVMSFGNSMSEGCRQAGIAPMTFLDNVEPGRYARAREVSASVQFDEMHLLENKTLGFGLEYGETPLDPQRYNVVANSRKWRLARMHPKAYGDKVGVELTGKDGGPIQHQDMSQLTDEQLHAILAQGSKE